MNGEVPFATILTDRTSTLPRPVDVRDAWRDAATDVQDAYRFWSTAPLGHRSEAHAVYVAAMDREAAAARYLRLVLDYAAGRP